MGQNTSVGTAIADNRALVSAWISVAVAIVGWSIYVGLMAVAPSFFANNTLRAIVRILVVLVPVIIHILRYRYDAPIDYLYLRQYWLRGIIIGSLVAGIYFVPFIFTTMDTPTLQLPDDVNIWLNFIVGSPFAEELLFRGVLFNELNRVMSSYLAILISSVMFAVLHLPVWIILEGFSVPIVAEMFVQILIYGIVFAGLLHITKSLWAALTVHWLNNFILLSVIDSALG